MVATSRTNRPPDGEPADVKSRIAALYMVHAVQIADALGDKPLCVVTAPRRFGKTTSLLPALATILRERGNSVHVISGRDYEDRPFTIESLPPGSFDVLIIDEANVLTRTKRKTRDLLLLLHQKGDAIVSVITHYAGYESGAQPMARTWQVAEFSISRQRTNVVRLPQMIVSPQMARDLLTYYSPVKNEAQRAQIVGYVVDRVPLNPHVLLELAGAESVTDLGEIVRHRKRTLFQRALTLGEYKKLQHSLEK
jgi:hypothetical protein